MTVMTLMKRMTFDLREVVCAKLVFSIKSQIITVSVKKNI